MASIGYAATCRLPQFLTPSLWQYNGRGRDDEAPDRYFSHCDGECSGRPFIHGERVSTTLMFCSVPDDGGHTNFANAAVNVKPKLGSALFFSYIDPERKVMDSGFTQHSGCPVFVGTKRVVLQVIRYGVDDDLPWNSWNSLGVRHSEALDYDTV
jgi:2OG-Fe(II) oxygenase superfamily